MAEKWQFSRRFHEGSAMRSQNPPQSVSTAKLQYTWSKAKHTARVLSTDSGSAQLYLPSCLGGALLFFASNWPFTHEATSRYSIDHAATQSVLTPWIWSFCLSPNGRTEGSAAVGYKFEAGTPDVAGIVGLGGGGCSD